MFVKRVSDTNSRYKRFLFIRSRFHCRIWVSVHDCAAISRSSRHVTRLAGTKWRPHARKWRKRLQTLAYRVFRDSKRRLPCLIQRYTIMDREKILAEFEKIERKLWILKHDTNMVRTSNLFFFFEEFMIYKYLWCFSLLNGSIINSFIIL